MYTFKFSICSLNVHGLRDKVKCNNVMGWLKISKFDVIFLQETYLNSLDFLHFTSVWNGPVFYSASASSHSCGVAIALSRSFSCKCTQLRNDSSGCCVSILCSIKNTSFRLCNVYAPCVPKELFVSLRTCILSPVATCQSF